MQGKRYDQRVLVLVEVRGEQRDWDEAERAFDQQGWPVVAAFARGEGASQGVLSVDASARLYSVEVRFFGARNRRTEQAAEWWVQRLARRTRLEMYARRCEPVDRDREQLTGWRAHTVAHRPPRVPDPRPLTPMARLRRSTAMARARLSEGSGRHDTGTLVRGTASEALRLSRMDLPGGSAPEAAIDVRARHGRERRHIVQRREEDHQRVTSHVMAWTFAMLFCVVVARQASGARTWVWGAAAVLCLLWSAWLTRGVFAEGVAWGASSRGAW